MSRSPVWMRRVLAAAALYNVLWGSWVVLFPHQYFELVGMEPPRYVQLWQCIGMIVGVYGLGYAAAARDPLRHWPIVLVGLLGKIFGPIGFVQAIATGALPWSFGWILLSNDLVWWVPFSVILWRAFEHANVPATEPELEALDRDTLLRTLVTSDGKSLFEHSVERPQLVVFTRHFGCTFCREALADLARVRPALADRGVGLLVVHMGSRAEGDRVLAAHGLDGVAHLSDPSTRLYRAFELSRGGFRQLFGANSWKRGVVAGLRDRHGIGRLVGDGFQMPGVFLLDRGEIVQECRHADAAQRPDYLALASCPVRTTV